METKTNETFSKNGKTKEKSQGNEIDTLMDFYNKQLKLFMGFYNKMLAPNSDQASQFTKDERDAGALFLSNPLANWISEFNRSLIVSLNGLIPTQETATENISKKYKETLETRFEVARKTMNALADAYNKQLQFATRNNQELMAEINRQFHIAVKQNQELWLTIFSMYRLPLKETKTNESVTTRPLEQTEPISKT